VGGIDNEFWLCGKPRITEHFYARYRVFALSELDGCFAQSLSVVHGPELNLTSSSTRM